MFPKWLTKYMCCEFVLFLVNFILDIDGTQNWIIHSLEFWKLLYTVRFSKAYKSRWGQYVMKFFGSPPCHWLPRLLSFLRTRTVDRIWGQLWLLALGFLLYRFRREKFLAKAQDYSMFPCCWRAPSFIWIDEYHLQKQQDCLQLTLN